MRATTPEELAAAGASSHARTRLSRAAARRVALAAQGLADPRPVAPTARHLDRVLSRLALLQIDAVNVLQRAHYVPPFSRLGPYDAALLDGAAYSKKRKLFEYWAHEASLVRLDLHPALRWRMERARAGEGIYTGLRRFAEERRPFIDAVLREVETRGPLTAGELETGGAPRAGGWWGWSDAKRALEWLFWAGLVTTRTRRAGFDRVYDLTERVIPPEILALPTPPVAEAHRDLVRAASRALGVATAADLTAYFRLRGQEIGSRIAELVEEGELLPVAVEGWRQPAFLDPAARIPRRIEARALVSPFDPLLFERDRAERLFDFRYRIEIYTPAEKREFGYYVLPFLLGDRLVARLDLKADRAARRLIVHAAHLESGAAPDEVYPALAEELRALAEWLGLAAIVPPAGHALTHLVAG